MEEDHLTPEQLATLKEIRARKGVIVRAHRMKKAVANNQAVLPRRADAGRTATTRNLKARAPALLVHPSAKCHTLLVWMVTENQHVCCPLSLHRQHISSVPTSVWLSSRCWLWSSI